MFTSYNTYFLITTNPNPKITKTTNVPAAYCIVCSNIPVEIVNSTGASSISSSPFFLLSGVESLSGTPFSL